MQTTGWTGSALLAGTVASLAIILDLFSVYDGLALPITYELAIVVAAWTRSRRFVWTLTATLLVAVSAGLLMGRPLDESVAERALLACSLVAIALVVHLWIRTWEELAANGRALAERNLTLERTNETLVRHGDEVARQGETMERELALYRREVEDASVRKTRFLAAVSHDIRTPANAIRLRAEVIRRVATNETLMPRIPAMVEELQASAVALVELVGEVLDLTRFDTGRIELDESEFLVGELLAEECRQLTPLAQAKGLRLTCGALDPTLSLRTDRIKLARVVANLLENGIKFSRTGDIHAVAAVAIGGSIEIGVRDTGAGIAPEHLDGIFDEFVQLRNPERDHTKGRGLGLAICKRLVEAMGGNIRVESTLGRGSTFTVVLPRSVRVIHAAPPRAPVGEPPLAGDGPRLAGLRVLVIEDHASTRRDLSELLRTEGALVFEAEAAAPGLAAFRSWQPNVVLLDLMLPDRDGGEVLKTIAAARPPALRSVLVLTGDTASRRAEDLQRLGAEDVLTKPIDPERLITRLRSARDVVPRRN
jgi:signal transduction histidine kinase